MHVRGSMKTATAATSARYRKRNHTIVLYMVIERFKNGDIEPVGRRFRESGRQMPETLEYISSWIDEPGSLCYQLVESPERRLLDEWMSHWDDLVDFEVVPVLTSADFWEQRAGKQAKR